jgi:hypothetical protein
MSRRARRFPGVPMRALSEVESVCLPVYKREKYLTLASGNRYYNTIKHGFVSVM